MANEKLKELWRLRNWMASHKSISAAFIAVIMAGSAFGGIIAFEHNEGLHMGATAGSISFSQSVYFNGTNANLNPITYNGISYTSSSQLYTQIGTTQNFNGPGNSTTDFTFGNFEPGDYILMTVNLTNTGHSILLLNQTTYLAKVSGSILLSNGSWYANETVDFGVTNYNLSPVNTPSLITGYYLATTSATVYNNYGGLIQNDNIWIAGISTVNNTAIPQYLYPGQTWAYSLFIGLGNNATDMYGSSSYLDVSIPLMPAR